MNERFSFFFEKKLTYQRLRTLFQWKNYTIEKSAWIEMSYFNKNVVLGIKMNKILRCFGSATNKLYITYYDTEYIFLNSHESSAWVSREMNSN